MLEIQRDSQILKKINVNTMKAISVSFFPQKMMGIRSWFYLIGLILDQAPRDS